MTSFYYFVALIIASAPLLFFRKAFALLLSILRLFYLYGLSFGEF